MLNKPHKLSSLPNTTQKLLIIVLFFGVIKKYLSYDEIRQITTEIEAEMFITTVISFIYACTCKTDYR